MDVSFMNLSNPSFKGLQLGEFVLRAKMLQKVFDYWLRIQHMDGTMLSHLCMQ